MNAFAIKRLGLVIAVTTTMVVGAILLTAAGGSEGDHDDEDSFTAALWGDMPYIKGAVEWTSEAQVANLIADVNTRKVSFSVFDGDIKSGSTLCNDAQYTNAVARFNTLKSPAVYVPGDNEWTDCHRTNNGSFNALERLTHIRQTMFDTVMSFGQKKMKLEHQGLPGQPYSENTRWVKNGVVFVGLNVPGSNNNFVGAGQCPGSGSTRSAADCAADNAEYLERNAKNLEWIDLSFDLARKIHAPGILFVFQTDPGFDIPETATFEREPGPSFLNVDPTFDHITDTLVELRKQTLNFQGQVVLVHGDTHFFKVDKPILMPFPDDSASPAGPYHVLPNFTRVETFGESNADWIRVTVNPKSRNVFNFEPMIVAANH